MLVVMLLVDIQRLVLGTIVWVHQKVVSLPSVLAHAHSSYIWSVFSLGGCRNNQEDDTVGGLHAGYRW